MKIALFVPAWPPGESPSGITTYASQLVPALRRLGHEVFLLTFEKGPDDSDPHSIDLQRFVPSQTLWDRAMYKIAPTRAVFKTITTAITSALSELLDTHGLEVFEIEESFGWSYAISRKNLLPVVVRLHGTWHLNRKLLDPDNALVGNRGREVWEGKGLSSAQLITTPSAKILELTRRYYGFELKTCRVIRNPIKADAATTAWNIQTCTKDTLLFVGRFDAPKGGDLVLRAFAELAELYPLLRLTFVGPDVGLNSDGGKVLFREFVQNHLPQWCHNRIDFRGFVNRSDIMDMRTKHFLTVVASQQEVMPYSVLEAMSLGCPLVATAVGGIPEIITNLRNGLLVPSQDVMAMASACRKLLDDHVFAARIGRQAWQDCRDLCGPELIANQTVAAYRDAIAGFAT